MSNQKSQKAKATSSKKAEVIVDITEELKSAVNQVAEVATPYFIPEAPKVEVEAEPVIEMPEEAEPVADEVKEEIADEKTVEAESLPIKHELSLHELTSHLFTGKVLTSFELKNHITYLYQNQEGGFTTDIYQKLSDGKINLDESVSDEDFVEAVAFFKSSIDYVMYQGGKIAFDQDTQEYITFEEEKKRMAKKAELAKKRAEARAKAEEAKKAKELAEKAEAEKAMRVALEAEIRAKILAEMKAEAEKSTLGVDNTGEGSV